MDFIKILDLLLEKKKVNKSTFLSDLGYSKNAYSEWKSGFTKSYMNKIDAIADYFNVSTDYLLNREEIPKMSSKGVLIPILGQVIAGIPIDAVEDILGYEEISREMATHGEYFALQIKGNSMEPRMRQGDVVIVKKQSAVESGDIAVVLVNGDEATIKKFVIHDNGVSLISNNEAYSPMFYTKKEIEEKPVTVLGKVVELRAKF